MADRLRRGRRIPYAAVPEALLLDPTVSSHAKVVWGILDRRIDNREDSDTAGTAFPGRQWVADAMGVSVPTVDRAFKELEVKGWIDVDRPAGGRRNSYIVHSYLVITHEDQRSSPVRTTRSSPMRTTRNESKENESKGTNPNPATRARQLGLDGEEVAPVGAGGEGSPLTHRRRPARRRPVPPPPPDPARAEAEARAATARGIAEHVCVARRPAPMKSVREQTPVYDRALAAGWTADEVRQAAMAASTITDGALELQLNQIRPPAAARKTARASGNGRLYGAAYDDHFAEVFADLMPEPDHEPRQPALPPQRPLTVKETTP